jgi:predicted AAA+ superfamily ATPase
MYTRSIYHPLLEHLPKKQVTVITGMRRVGKSTAVKYLLEQIKHSNKIYLDCERIEVRVLLNKPNYEAIAAELQLMGVNFSQPCVIALDEIQLVENLPSLIKYIYDTYHIKFIVTGSSSYYMKNLFSESLAGRKRIFEIYPLSFDEFLLFKKMPVTQLEKFRWQSCTKSLYDRYSQLYEEYMQFGGFPEVVLEENKVDKIELLNDIINSHIELDIKLLSDYVVSEGLYKLVKLLAARTGNKVDFTKLGSLTGINRQKIAAYIQLLEYTYLIYLVAPFTKNIDNEISHQPKLYFSDTGILNALAGDKLSSGQLFENAIAAQLRPQGEIHYYQKKTGQEIDFIYKGETAIEVKETAIEKDNLSLHRRASAIDIKKKVLVSRYTGRGSFDDFVWGGSIF